MQEVLTKDTQKIAGKVITRANRVALWSRAYSSKRMETPAPTKSVRRSVFCHEDVIKM